MQHVFACWNELSGRLAASRTVALFLDFDGTLVAIERRPEFVRLHPAIRATLAALGRNPRLRVWVISARRRTDIRARVRVAAIRYLGLYGWERGDPMPPRPASLACVKEVLTATLPMHPAVWIEDKEYTLAAHYRSAPESIRRVIAERVQRAVDPWRGDLRIVPGKCVWEVVPRELGDKGAAVRRELAGLPPRALPLYLGDDVSDEPAFGALPRMLGIRVGDAGRTRASYRLTGAGEVRHFLQRLRSELL